MIKTSLKALATCAAAASMVMSAGVMAHNGHHHVEVPKNFTVNTDIADTIYINGKVWTVDQRQAWAEGFAVAGDRFLAVGSSKNMMKYKGKKTKVVDLKGQFVMPGMIEDHVHPDMVAENLMNVNVTEGMTYDDFKAAIQKFLKENPDTKWVFGGPLNWLQDKGADIVGWEGIPSHKNILDDIVTDRPAFFWDVGAHAALVNSKAMEKYNVKKGAPIPKGGSWDEDANGNLTGVLRETAANAIWEEFLKDRENPEQQALRGFGPAIDELTKQGFTSITDVWARPWNIHSYKYLEEKGQLNARVTMYLTDPVDWTSQWIQDMTKETIANYKNLSTEMIDVMGIKFVMDGSAGGQTAMMVDPFEGTDNHGFWRNDPDYFKKMIVEYDKMGLTVRAHAVGDQAIRTVLDGIESTRDKGSKLRHSVSHTVFVNPADIKRFKQLDVVAEMSPYFWMDGPHVAAIEADVGKERLEWLFPFNQFIERGVMMSAGSDWPVSSPWGWGALESMITRLAPGQKQGNPMNAKEGISVEAAIEIFTMGGAYAQYKEDDIGSIQGGKYADFIILNQNLLEVPVGDIHKTEVQKTFLGGKEIYSAK